MSYIIEFVDDYFVMKLFKIYPLIKCTLKFVGYLDAYMFLTSFVWIVHKAWIFIQRGSDKFAWGHFAILFLQQLHQEKINLTTATNIGILTLTLNVWIYKHCMISRLLSILLITRIVCKGLYMTMHTINIDV